MFQHGLANAGHDAAMALPMHQHGVDRHAHIIHCRVIGECHFTGCGFNLNLGDMTTIREIAFRVACVGELFIKPRGFIGR